MNRFDELYEATNQIEHVEGATMIEVLALPESLREVVRGILRSGALSAEDLAAELDLTLEQARQIGDALVAKGFLSSEERQAQGGLVYRVYLAHTRARGLSLDI
jgi:predicted ArsR family transcriptional regulator